MREMRATEDEAQRSGFDFSKPSTALGWWAVGLWAAFAAMMAVNTTVFMHLAESVPWRRTVLPFFGIGMMACAVVSGIVAVAALLGKREHSSLVWLPVVSGGLAVVFVLGELLVPH